MRPGHLRTSFANAAIGFVLVGVAATRGQGRSGFFKAARKKEELIGGKELAAEVATTTCVGVMIVGLIFLTRQNITLFVYAATDMTASPRVSMRVSVVVVMIAGLIFLTRLNITLFVYAATNGTTANAAAVVEVGAAWEEEEEVMGGKELAAVVATATCVGVMIAGLIFLTRQNITLFVYAATNETTDRTAAVVAVGAADGCTIKEPE